MITRQFLIAAILAIVAAPCLGQTVSDVPDILTLETARERVIQKNLTVDAARLEVSAGKAQIVAAGLRPRPTMNISAENLRVSGPTPYDRLYEAGTTITQPFELGGQRRARVEVAKQGVTVAEAKLEGVMRQRLYEMRVIFYETLLAQVRVDTEEENSRNFDELLRYNEVRLKEGDISPGEMIKLRLEKIKYTSALANARLALKQAKIKLLQILGETDFVRSEQIQLREPFEFQAYSLNLAELKQFALDNRPEIKIAESELSRAESVLKLERARGKGELEPYVGYKRVGPDNTVLAGVSVPLPFGNRNHSAIAQAEADQRIAENALLQTKNRTLAEVELAFQVFETAREQVKAFEAGVLKQADESRDITLLTYREGATELINLLEAQRTRTEVWSSYYQALLAYYTSLFQLELVTGQEIKSK